MSFLATPEVRDMGVREKAVITSVSSIYPTPSQCAGCLEKLLPKANATQKNAIPPIPTSHKFANPKNIYRPLDDSLKEIRLLFVQPGGPASPIYGTLHTFNLTHHNIPKFDALSYEWGRENSKALHASQQSVVYLSQCRGKKSARFRVRQNLFLALKELRAVDEPMVIWIDAICVDQGNMRERSHQVGLMRLIYTSARNTHVWLGPEDEGHDAPFDLLDRINRELRALEIQARQKRQEIQERQRVKDELLRKQQSREAKKKKLLDKMPFSVSRIFVSPPTWNPAPAFTLEASLENEINGVEAGEDGPLIIGSQEIENSMNVWGVTERRNGHEWKSLCALLTRTYWNRIWIVQEFLLARKITLHCGPKSISWDDFIEGLHYVRKYTPIEELDAYSIPRVSYDYLTIQSNQANWSKILEDIKSTKRTIGVRLAMMRQKVVAGGKHQLLDLFVATKESRCGDPRDRVYALLGLACDIKEDSIIVDYVKSPIAVQADVMAFFGSQLVEGLGIGHDLTYVSSLLVGMLYSD